MPMNVKNSDIASKPITTSLTSKAVHEKYFNDLWGELEEYWKVLNSIQGMKIDELFQGFSTSKPIYWFVDITFHCEDFSRRVLKHELKKFPASISRAKEFEKASGEFCYLFPQSELTAQFLPLLLTCYFLRRNVQEEFVKHLRYHSNYISLSDIRRKIKKFQAIPRLEDEYKSLFAGKTSRIISLENLSRVQAIYRKIIVFFFFLNATTVNVALSFFAFEAMTGYISLLDSKANKFIDTLNKLGPQKIFEPNPELESEIHKYVNNVLRDFYKMRMPKRKDGKRSGNIYFPLHFLIFLGNLRDTLYFDTSNDGSKAKVSEDDSDFFSTLDSWREFIETNQKNRDSSDSLATESAIKDLSDLLMEELETPEDSQD